MPVKLIPHNELQMSDGIQTVMVPSKREEVVANNRSFSNEIRFRKTSPIPKRITWREDPTGGVPPRPPPAQCRQGSSQFLVIRIVRGASVERISNSHWPGSIVHHLSCPSHRLPWDYHYWRVLGRTVG